MVLVKREKCNKRVGRGEVEPVLLGFVLSKKRQIIQVLDLQ